MYLKVNSDFGFSFKALRKNLTLGNIARHTLKCQNRYHSLVDVFALEIVLFVGNFDSHFCN